MLGVGDLAKLSEENSQIPDDDHEPFVLVYQIIDQDDPDTLIDNEDPRDQFRVVIITRFLLKFSVHFKLVIQTDGTYKLVWQGFQ